MFNPSKLKKIRNDKNLTQTDLMFELDKSGLRISRQTLINWEHGRSAPKVNELSIIANFFNKSIQYFFD